MINVSELLCDPDFCVEFKIVRNTGKRENRRWVAVDKPKLIQVLGIVNSTSSEDIEMIPEGDRVQGLKTFYSGNEFRLTDDKTTSDIVEYKGKRYRLLQVFDYSNNGYYKAIGTLQGGD